MWIELDDYPVLSRIVTGFFAVLGLVALIVLLGIMLYVVVTYAAWVLYTLIGIGALYHIGGFVEAL